MALPSGGCTGRNKSLAPGSQLLILDLSKPTHPNKTKANSTISKTRRAYNEPPSVKDRIVADEILLTKTELLMMDYNSPNLNPELWFADIEGKFTIDTSPGISRLELWANKPFSGYYVSEEDCDFEFGLGVYGTAKLFVNGDLVIDNDTKQTKGTLFFCCGTVEEKATVPMKKGQTYHLKIEFGSASTCKLNQGSNVLAGGGAVRLGGAKVLDPDEEVLRAVKLAKEADQVIICAGLNVSSSDSISE